MRYINLIKIQPSEDMLSARTEPSTQKTVSNFRRKLCRTGLLWCLLCFLAAALAGCGAKTPPPPGSKGSAKAQQIVSTAYSQMGKRYRAGGDSPQKGFDCSGLIWWAYSKHGIDVPRITKDQARAGVSVPVHKSQPGDIIVFRTSQGPQGLHTALYSGDGTFIHSPRRGERVRIESIETPYWRTKLISIRRVVP